MFDHLPKHLRDTARRTYAALTLSPLDRTEMRVALAAVRDALDAIPVAKVS